MPPTPFHHEYSCEPCATLEDTCVHQLNVPILQWPHHSELHPSENASQRTHSQHSKDPHLLRALAKKLKSNKQDIYFMFFNNFFLSNFAELSLGELLYGCLQHTTLECFLCSWHTKFLILVTMYDVRKQKMVGTLDNEHL